jgi:hypothetical protein
MGAERAFRVAAATRRHPRCAPGLVENTSASRRPGLSSPYGRGGSRLGSSAASPSVNSGPWAVPRGLARCLDARARRDTRPNLARAVGKLRVESRRANNCSDVRRSFLVVPHSAVRPCACSSGCRRRSSNSRLHHPGASDRLRKRQCSAGRYRSNRRRIRCRCLAPPWMLVESVGIRSDSRPDPTVLAR